MPCSCGNTVCPCGIPCYCSAELCKCHDCAIAVSPICNICNKHLSNECQTDNDICSCFLGDLPALIFENRDNSKIGMINSSQTFNSSVSAILRVNVMIPIPVLNSSELISPKSLCLEPPLPSNGARNFQSISDEDSLKSLHPEDYSDLPLTEKPLQLLNEIHNQSDGCYSSGYSSSSEENTEILQETRISPALLSADENQNVNIIQSAKVGTEECVNVQDKTYFYLPSVRIGDASYNLNLMDPVWRLQIPAVSYGGSYVTELKLFNPFKAAAHAPNLKLDENDTYLQMTEQATHLILPTNSNSVFNLRHRMNNLGPCDIKPNESKSNAVLSANAPEFISQQPQTIDSALTFAAGNNDCHQTCPDSNNLSSRFSVNSEPTYEMYWQGYWPSFPDYQVPAASTGSDAMDNSGTVNPTSKLQKLFDRVGSSEQSSCSQNSNSAYNNGNHGNLPLYVDFDTTLKMERLLKSALK